MYRNNYDYNDEYYSPNKKPMSKGKKWLIGILTILLAIGCVGGITYGVMANLPKKETPPVEQTTPPVVEDTVTPDKPVEPEAPQDTREYPINLTVYKDTAVNKDLELDLSTATFYENIDSSLTETEEEIFKMNNLVFYNEPPFDLYFIMLDEALKPYSEIEVFINGYDMSFNYRDARNACMFGIFKIKDNFVQVLLPIDAGPQDFIEFHVSKNLDDFKDPEHTLRFVEVDALNIDIIYHS